MQLNLDEILQVAKNDKTVRKVEKEDINRIYKEILKRHKLPKTPVTYSLLLVYLLNWYKKKFFFLEKRVNQLSDMSQKEDITKKREYMEFMAVSYIYFFRKGVQFD